MKTKTIVLLVVSLLVVSNLYAASGDLVVNGILSAGTVSVGSGGVKYTDGSVQTSAKRLVWDYTVPSATTSVTSPALDGNADGGYVAEFVIYNSTGGMVLYRLYFNNDKINTNYNYTEIYNAGGSGIGQGGADALLDGVAAGVEETIWGDLSISPRGYVRWHHHSDRSDNYQTIFGIKKNAAVANLTSIDIVASPPNGIGVNSRFRLWKKKP